MLESWLQVELWFFSGFHWGTSPMLQTVNKAWLDLNLTWIRVRDCSDCAVQTNKLWKSSQFVSAPGSDCKHWNLMFQFEDHEPWRWLFFLLFHCQIQRITYVPTTTLTLQFWSEWVTLRSFFLFLLLVLCDLLVHVAVCLMSLKHILSLYYKHVH